MSRTGITQEQVFTAAQRLADADHPVTAHTVREALGAGSFTTLSQHLRQWRADAHLAVSATPLPPEVDAAADKAATAIWAVATDRARGELEAHRQTAQAQVSAAQLQTQEALQEVARLESRAEHDHQQLAECARQNETLRTGLGSAEATLAAQRATLEQLSARVQELKLDAEKAHAANAQKAEECGRLQGELAVRAELGSKADSA